MSYMIEVRKYLSWFLKGERLFPSSPCPYILSFPQTEIVPLLAVYTFPRFSQEAVAPP